MRNDFNSTNTIYDFQQYFGFIIILLQAKYLNECYRKIICDTDTLDIDFKVDDKG